MSGIKGVDIKRKKKEVYDIYTSAPIGTFEVIIEIMTDHRNDRPTDRQTDEHEGA